MAKTIISQGHLSPFSLNALTTHWAFDYTLRLYPLPDLVIIGDKSECYSGVYKGCTVVNPVSALPVLTIYSGINGVFSGIVLQQWISVQVLHAVFEYRGRLRFVKQK